MPRRTQVVTIQDEGRDKGKTYFLTEMPASQAEMWATRALQALARSGVDLGPGVFGSGMAGIAVAGVQALAKMPYDELKPLMDDMFTCVRFLPDPWKNPDFTRPLIEDDIEEIQTRLRLRMEVFTLHTGFSMAGGPSTSSPTPTPPASPRLRTPRRR